MAFNVFLLINLVLFLRPAEIFPEMEGWPLYEALMIVGMLLTAPSMLDQLRWGSLRENPITACVLAIFGSMFVSTTLKVSGTNGYDAAMDFVRVVIFYLMLVSVVNSAERLRQYLIFLAFCFLLLAILPLAQEYGYLQIHGMQSLAQRERAADGTLLYTVQRLQGTGIFNDPNDLATILVAGLTLTTTLRHWYPNGMFRFLWLPLCVPMAVAIVLTQSRGGMAALLAAITAWLGLQYGWRRAAYVPVVIAPAILFLVGGRVADVDSAMGHGTGQSRLQHWSNGLAHVRASFPIGIGYQQTPDVNDGLVLHNSFLEAFLEMGFFGGTGFLGALVLALVALAKSPIFALPLDAERLTYARTALFCSLVGAGVGMVFVSRQYTVTPYLFFGLATIWGRLAGTAFVWPRYQLNWDLCKQLATGSVCLLGFLYLAVNTFVRFS